MGCHCGRLKPNAHKFMARFEFKWKCDQISVEPRRGEIAMDEVCSIKCINYLKYLSQFMYFV